MYTIDNNLIADGVKGDILSTLIEAHKTNVTRFEKLLKYYLGNHDILTRKMSDDSLPNNKLVCNFAKYITIMASGYLLGVPVEYKADTVDGKEIDITKIKDAYYAQTISNLDSELAKEASIFGIANELVYSNVDSNPASTNISPLNSFLVCDDTVEHKKLFAVHFYPVKDIKGAVTNNIVKVYTETEIITFKSTGDSYTSITEDQSEGSREPHYFGEVPFVEYQNNAECQGDFEQVVNLVDAYEILQSDRVNDKEQLVDALLVISGANIEAEDYAKLKEQRGLNLPEGADAKYLIKNLIETEVEVLKKAIADDIHRFSQVPNLTDESFAGNLSGVAIRYKLFGFDQLIKDKERFFETGLMKRFELYNNFLNIKANVPIVNTVDVSAIFSRNLPVNELELSQMAANLKDIISDESLIRMLTPLLSSLDVDEEIGKLKKQREEAAKNAAANFGIPSNQPAESLSE